MGHGGGRCFRENIKSSEFSWTANDYNGAVGRLNSKLLQVRGCFPLDFSGLGSWQNGACAFPNSQERFQPENLGYLF